MQELLVPEPEKNIAIIQETILLWISKIKNCIAIVSFAAPCSMKSSPKKEIPDRPDRL